MQTENAAIQQTLELRDIHLPEPISWWPVAPGWWMVFATLLFIIFAAIITRKIYQRRQLKRDIAAELNQIKQQFKETQNKSQLAKSLSILLRRASISYYPTANIAGLTGESWLRWLDDSHNVSTDKIPANTRFQSDSGKILLNAPYLPAETELDFDAEKLLDLCTSWLMTAHSRKYVQHIKRTASR